MLTKAAITGLVVTAIIQKLKLVEKSKPKIPVWMVDDLLSTINAGIEDHSRFT
jgi:hypothetical protein